MLQQGRFDPDSANGERVVELIARGRYIELSVDGEIVLTLADSTFTGGRAGFYVDGTSLRVRDVTLERLEYIEEEALPASAG